MGDSCNLNCSYCYTHHRNGYNGKLAIPELCKLIGTISTLNGLKYVNFTWHGGEPLLMGIDYFRKIIEYQKAVAHTIKYDNVIQSNGLLLDEEWIQYFIKEHISLGISIDGTDYESNRNRFASETQFELLLSNLRALKSINYRPAFFFTITQENINRLEEIFDFIEDYRPFSYMFNPVMDEHFAITADQWCHTLKMMKAFSERTRIMNALTFHIDNGIHGEIPKLCLINGMCNKFISVDNTGNIFASCICHSSNLRLSNVSSNSLYNDIQLYIDTPVRNNSPSIYHRLGRSPQFRYFQGSGCEKCRTHINNEEFVNGIVKYILETTGVTIH